MGSVSVFMVTVSSALLAVGATGFAGTWALASGAVLAMIAAVVMAVSLEDRAPDVR